MADELKFAVRCGGSTKKKANKSNNEIYLPFDTINLKSQPLISNNNLSTSKSELLNNNTNNIDYNKKRDLIIIENGGNRNLAANIQIKPSNSSGLKEENTEEPVPVDVFNSHKKISKKLNDSNKKKFTNSLKLKNNNLRKSCSVNYLENNHIKRTNESNNYGNNNNNNNDSYELLNLDKNFNKNNKIYYH
jgi:hypothetical protein